MSNRTDELAPASRLSRCPDPWHLANHFTPSSCPTCTATWSPGPRVRKPAVVREITREDRERAAFRRMSLAVAALLKRGECDA